MFNGGTPDVRGARSATRDRETYKTYSSTVYCVLTLLYEITLIRYGTAFYDGLYVIMYISRVVNISMSTLRFTVLSGLCDRAPVRRRRGAAQAPLSTSLPMSVRQ